MSTTIKAETYIKNQTNHYHYHGTEPEPLQEVLIEESHDTTEDTVEAEIQPVKARTFGERVRSLEPVKKRLLFALKGSRKAKLNQEQLRARINANTEDMVTCLRGNTKLFAMRKERLAFIWYLTKQGKRLKKLKAPKLAAKRAYQSNNRKVKDS